MRDIAQAIARCSDGFDPAILDCIADDPRLLADIMGAPDPPGAFDPRAPWPRDEDGGEG